MSKTERVALWVVVAFLGLWLLVGTVMVVGELQTLNALVAAGADQSPTSQQAGGEPTPWWGGGSGEDPADVPPAASGPHVGIAGVRAVSDTVAMTVTVRASGAGDLLYEPPILVGEDGRQYPVTSASLEEARFAFLDLVTGSQARATLVFRGSPAAGERMTLVLNPGQLEGDLLSPRIAVPVPVSAPTPTPTPEPEPLESDE